MKVLDHAPSGYVKVPLKYGPYSASRLIVARCPARFESKYIKKDRIVSDTVASARGAAIHLVLQKITESRVRGDAITPDTLNKWIELSIGNFPAAYQQVDLVKGAANAYVGNPSPYINKDTGCEKELAVSLYEEESFVDDAVPNRAYVKVPLSTGNGYGLNPEAFFGAKIDQLSIDHTNKVITVLDHKSTPSANKDPDHIFQLGLYAWVVSLFAPPGYQIRTVIHYAHPDLNFYAPPIYWKSEDLQEAESELLTRVRSIESFREYPALPGSHCDYCHMAAGCPELKDILDQSAQYEVDTNIRSADEMVKAARKLRVVGVVYDRLNTSLRESIKKYSPTSGIAIEGMWYGYRPSESVDWVATDRRIREEANKAEVLAQTAESPSTKHELNALVEAGNLAGLLKRFGLEADNFKEWKKDKLKALWKSNKPGLLNILQKYVVIKKSTRFGGYKQ